MLDEETLEVVVRSEVGPLARVWPHDRGNGSPMSTVLDAVEEAVGYPFAVFWVDGGLPENFSLRSLSPAVIIFNSRYLELFGYLRNVLTSDVLLDEQYIEVAERVSLRIIAELTLRYGDPALACYLFEKSLIGERTTFLQPDLRTLELAPRDEPYMAVWFFALLHELGHVRAGLPGGSDGRLYGESLDALIDDVMIAALGDPSHPYVQDRIRNPKGHSLDHAVLGPELDADLFATEMLFAATAEVMRLEGTPDEFSAGELAVEILRAFRVFYYMNSCSQIARLVPGALADPWVGVAHEVRANVILDFLSAFVGTDGNHDDEQIARVRSVLLDRIDDPGRVAAFENGHARALGESLHPGRRSLDVLERFARYLETDGGGPVFQTETDRFCALARSLEVTHPDLDLLDELRTRPAEAADVLNASRRVFLVAWVRGPGGEVPLVLRARDGFVVFAFTRKSTAEAFVEASRGIVEPGSELTTTPIISPTEHNVSVTIHRWLPDHEAGLHIVFEESAAFDRRYRELKDGTFWPDP
jgi:hypothetical protein